MQKIYLPASSVTQHAKRRVYQTDSMLLDGFQWKIMHQQQQSDWKFLQSVSLHFIKSQILTIISLTLALSYKYTLLGIWQMHFCLSRIINLVQNFPRWWRIF